MLSLLLLLAAEVAASNAVDPSLPLLPSPPSLSNSTFLLFLSNVQHHLLHNNQLSLVIAFSLLSLAYGLYTLYRPSSYAITITQLYIYPIKGCAGIPLTSSRYDRLGLLHDRRWMLVHADPTTYPSFLLPDTHTSSIDRTSLHRDPHIPTFLSQRTHPRMALLTPHIDAAARTLTLTFPPSSHLAPLVIPLTPPILSSPSSPPTTLPVKLWSDVVLTSIYTDPLISSSLSTFLGTPTLLVTLHNGHSATHHRPLDPRFDPSPPALSIHSAFSDGYPFLLTSSPSLSALNAACATRTTPMLAFRPNIVVDGPPTLLPPWAEDYWKEIRVEGVDGGGGGSGVFVASKPCARCAVPTVHPETGERDAAYEPIATMREQVRAKTVGEDGKGDGKVYFGMNLVQMKTEGVLSVGDLVTVLSKKQRFMEMVRDKKND